MRAHEPGERDGNSPHADEMGGIEVKRFLKEAGSLSRQPFAGKAAAERRMLTGAAPELPGAERSDA